MDKGIIERTMNHIARLEKSLAEYEAELAKHQWIKCSERLPEEEGYYLTGRPRWPYARRDWFSQNSNGFIHCVWRPTHWMPLPELPKEE